MGGALAFWMGNPLLNPATLVFMGFVLGWQFALIRLAAGLATVLIVATLVQKWVKEAATQPSDLPAVDGTAQGAFFTRWLSALWTLFWNTIPVYILAVLVLRGRHVSELFPHADGGGLGNTLFWVVAMAIAICLFVIPTAAESYRPNHDAGGNGVCPGMALLITLPAVSVPSLIMLRKAFPAKALWLTGGLVALCGARWLADWRYSEIGLRLTPCPVRHPVQHCASRDLFGTYLI